MIRNQRHNNRGSKFRSNDRNFRNNRSNGFKSNSNRGYQSTFPGRNNQNASKMIEKYNNLGREALANGDKVASENFYQHADHFLRISLEQESHKAIKTSNENTVDQSNGKSLSENELKTNKKEVTSNKQV